MSSKIKLISASVALLLILVGLVTLIFRDPPIERDELTKEQLSRYQEGVIHRTVVTSTVQGQIEDKDWGLETSVTLIHQGEVDFLRTVQETDHEKGQVVIALEILKARDLEAKLNLDDITLDLPPAVGVLGKIGVGKLIWVSPTAAVSVAAGQRAAQWLKADANRQKILSRLSSAVKLATGRSIDEHLLSARLQPLEAYEGLKADYTYTAGEGLTAFDTQASLTPEQEDRVKKFSVYSEAYLLPDPSESGPQQWTVDVANIAHLLAPAQTLDVTGTLTLERGEKSGTIMDLHIIKGKVVFSGGNDRSQVLGTWAARGTLRYDLATHHIVTGDLTGDVSLERRSTDHILFEETFKSSPGYRVLIKGFQTRDEADARRVIDHETLEQE